MTEGLAWKPAGYYRWGFSIMNVPVRDFLITFAVFAVSAGLVRVVTLLPQEPSAVGSRHSVAEEAARPPGLDVASALNEAMANVVEKTLPAYVSVDVDRQRTVTMTDTTALGPLTTSRTVREPGVGSGVIVSKEGLVITNWHVVAGEDVLIRVRLHGDDEPRRAKIIDRDETVDIALLRIEPRREGEPFPWMVFGDSDLMRPGNMVFALGNPLNLAETVTQGIISNRSRRVSDTLESFLQTDCTINPGNSGGPLVNIRGELIGINSRLVISPQQSAAGQAYGLAIPGNEVQDAYERMIHKGRPRGYLGITVDDWPDMSYQSGGKPQCAIVAGVEKKSPAAAAGLKKNDRILAMDGEPVRGRDDFYRRLRKHQVGEEISIGLKRDEESLTVPATVVDWKTIIEAEEVPESREVDGLSVRGLRRMEGNRVARMGLPEGGVVIERVAAKSEWQGRVSPGDTILRVQERASERPAGGPDPGGLTVPDFAARLKALKASGGGQIDVLRAQGVVDSLTFSGD